MTHISAFILGLIQGLTEFLPISSSAHLQLAKHMLGIQEDSTLFDLFCHLGTSLVLIYYFRKEIVRIFFTHQKNLFLLLVALLPLIPMYIFARPIKQFLLHTEFLGLCMMATALTLFITHRYTYAPKPAPMTIKDALYVGICQAFALAPGISRSAMTISAGLCRGIGALEAVQFSFLLSLPSVAGGLFLEATSASRQINSIPYSYCIIGLLASFIMGSITIHFAMPLLQKGLLRPFAWYCLIAGILLSIFL